MPIEIAILIYAIVTGYAVSLVCACFSLSGHNRLLDIWEEIFDSFRGRFPSLGKRDSPEQMLEESFRELRKCLLVARKALAQSKDAQRRLARELSVAEKWRGLTDPACPERLPSDALDGDDLGRDQKFGNAPDLSLVYLEGQVAVRKVEAAFQAQKQHTAMLEERVQALEGEVQRAYTKKQLLISQDSAFRCVADFNSLAPELRIIKLDSALAQMEKIVAQREAESRTNVLKISNLLSEKKIAELDLPGLENSKIILSDALAAMHSALEQSFANVAEVEGKIEKERQKSETWEKRAQMALSLRNEVFVEQARSRRDQHSKSMIQFSECLSYLKDGHASIAAQHANLQAFIDKIDARIKKLAPDTTLGAHASTEKPGA